MLFIKTFPPKAVRPRLFGPRLFGPRLFGPRLFDPRLFHPRLFRPRLALAASRRPFFIAAGPRQVSNVLTPNKTTALPKREAAAIVGCRFPDQLLRRPSAARFHCDTLSAIMAVDFIAARHG